MQENTDHIEITPLRGIQTSFPSKATEYSEILDYFRFEYKQVDSYYQVGNISWVQGWILHISVVRSQVVELMKVVLPLLSDFGTTFKIPTTEEVAINLLDGLLGYQQLGKLITIFPEKSSELNLLVNKLIKLTKPFKGPKVPTDAHLGGCIYTRYGSGNPVVMIDETGMQSRYIYNYKGDLVIDLNRIPFQIPEYIQWPFEEISIPTKVTPNKSLKNIYKPIRILKPDARGFVWQGLFLKQLYKIKKCIIKQGKNNMCHDENLRDIGSRLHWQKELHKNLAKIIPIPQFIDFFEENEDTFLVIEFINGISLDEAINLLYGSGDKIWHLFPSKKKLRILNYLENIIIVLKCLHENGYVHRDINPANFIITRKGAIFLIDMELTYSLILSKPNPPFGLGTPGFMSPEQQTKETPSIYEDIFGLSATMLNLFTGLHPTNFCTGNRDILYKNLFYFIKNNELVTLIIDGLNSIPECRPSLSLIQSSLEKYKYSLLSDTLQQANLLSKEMPDKNTTREMVQLGIKSLVCPPIALMGDLWLSITMQKDTTIGNMQKDYSIYPGLNEGIAGVLYFLSKAKTQNFNIDSCMQNYYKGWDFLQETYLNNLNNISPGLYHGAAGIILALSNGIKSGLLEPTTDTIKIIENSLSLKPIDLGLSIGIAGQGVAILRNREHLPGDLYTNLLEKCISLLLETQQEDGSWITKRMGKKEKSLSFANGVPGIIWFLLDFEEHYPNYLVQKAILKALKWVDQKTNHLKAMYTYERWVKTIGSDTIIEGGAIEILLTYIKAYKIFKTENLKKEAEKALHGASIYVNNSNFSQLGGLAALGELYIEAGITFENHEWKEKSARITNLLFHVCIRESDNLFWLTERSLIPTASLLKGNTGILNFLMHFQDEHIGYRFLS